MQLAVASPVSSLIDSAERGDTSATEALFVALYADLRRLARIELSRRAGSLTLTPTTLLHEAYLEISKRDGGMFPDRARFMAYAARVMRGIVIDHVRTRHALRRGGGFQLTALETNGGDAVAEAHDLTGIGDALDELATVDPALAEVVDLKFFCGFSFTEVAAMRGVSERTVQRQWEKARIYLYAALRDRRPVP